MNDLINFTIAVTIIQYGVVIIILGLGINDNEPNSHFKSARALILNFVPFYFVISLIRMVYNELKKFDNNIY